MDDRVGEALLFHFDQVRVFTRGVVRAHDRQGVEVRHSVNGRGAHPGQAQQRAQPDQQAGHEQVQVVARSLLQLVVLLVQDDVGEFDLHEDQDADQNGGDERGENPARAHATVLAHRVHEPASLRRRRDAQPIRHCELLRVNTRRWPVDGHHGDDRDEHAEVAEDAPGLLAEEVAVAERAESVRDEERAQHQHRRHERRVGRRLGRQPRGGGGGGAVVAVGVLCAAWRQRVALVFVPDVAERVVDENQRDHTREDLLGKAREVADQEAALQRHDPETDHHHPQADPGPPRQELHAEALRQFERVLLEHQQRPRRADDDHRLARKQRVQGAAQRGRQDHLGHAHPRVGLLA